jgi:hypothetical protein
LSRVDAIAVLAQWLRNPVNAKRLAGYVALFLPRIARSLPGPEFGEAVGKLAQQTLATLPAGPLASKLLSIVWAPGRSTGPAGRRDRVRRKLVSQQQTLSDPQNVGAIVALDSQMNRQDDC